MSESTPAKTQAIPEQAANVTAEEREEYEAYRSGEGNLYEPGIRVGDKGFYDPTEGSPYADEKELKPDSSPQKTFFADTSKKSASEAPRPKVISRDRNAAVDRSETPTARPTGRKSAKPGVDSK